jgi:catechol 2,3-dioxygenase-like lactoylglutathione lyase family enzyme
VTRFHHVGITVRDIDASYKFYRDVVGMRIWDQDAELGTFNPVRTESRAKNSDATFYGIKSAAFDELTDNPGSVFKYINLIMPDHFVFQLVEYTDGRGPDLDLDHNRAGNPHLSIFVDDLEAKFEEIQRTPGVEPISSIVAIQPDIHAFYVRDPDGMPIEFQQVVLKPSALNA